ncbi:ferric reductase NAD binding domain-containing protein [Dioszegia hungarica]|uniref:Ferric reductase NAD binding domain-containing protein n=1 Tax=Dioszegia hungarica TaxID=4972 RepID=A0AA38H806_9TREE|nr:ferric reductase NAD binding domain-containing protein [Dioszegia hungarica]KAI9635465.1 ferric reductase NAD binding domain-containing protein [Dioszegia hungarica]
MVDIPLDQPIVPRDSTRLRRNKTERVRLQGLVHTMRETKDGDGEEGGRVRKTLGRLERASVWMVNEGRSSLSILAWIILHIIAFALSCVQYGLKDNLNDARQAYGFSFVIARAAAQVLHIDVIFVLFPICRTFISLLRKTPLNSMIPFDKNIDFHKQIGRAIVFFTVVHIIAHVRNTIVMSMIKGTGVKGFLSYTFLSGPAWTGWIMTISLGIMVWFAMEKRKRANYERFYYSHHASPLFIVFFLGWQLHGMFCMIQPDRPPFCSASIIGVFWKYWLPGGIVFIIERILREIRAHHVTYISKVIQHPSRVLEIQIRKERTTPSAGQYIFINCPSVSYFQYHPFTLTSAPEETYLSVHMRCVGDWTNAFAKSVGVDWDAKDIGEKDEGEGEGAVVAPPVGKVLPRIMLDGPFGSASEDFANYETILLVGGGIGVTPFASILKTLWYRMNDFGKSTQTRLSKVYFVWVIRDFGLAEWFHSLLKAVEAEDKEGRIEIHVYLTAKIDDDKMNNIIVQDVGAEVDAITQLRAPTHFGRPNWDKVFQSIADKHADTDCGVFFCGPPVLSKTLHQMSNKYTTPKGCRFFFGKEVS